MHDPILKNALDAAATWLQRIDAPAGTCAVVQVRPVARVGAWHPGAPDVLLLAGPIDDPGAELCEAVAPLVEATTAMLTDAARRGLAHALVAGSRLQVLLAPERGDAVVRVIGPGGDAVVLAAASVADVAH